MYFHSICIVVLSGFVQAKQNLRHQPHGRQLKVTELVSFSAIVHVSASDEAINKKTASEEYNGALVGFRNWFQESTEAFYSSNPNYGVQYSSTGCELNQDSTSLITTPGEDYHHSIAISCQSTVLLDNSYDITSTALVGNAAEGYPHKSLPNYLDVASPANSPFGFPALQRIELELLASSSSRQSVTYTLPPKQVAQQEVSKGGNSSGPTRRIMPPVPLLPEEEGKAGEDDSDTPIRGTIPVVLEWEVSMHSNFENQEPSKRDSYSFMEATRSWMFDSIYEYYGDKDVATWNGVVNSYILEPSDDETAHQSHTVTIHYEAEFEEVPTGEVFYHSKLMLVMALTDPGAEGLQRDYLPNTGLFQASHVSHVAFHIKE